MRLNFSHFIHSPNIGARIAAFYWSQTRRFPPAAWEGLHLAKSTKLTFTWNRQLLNAHSWGNGPIILLVHGWNGRASQMSKIGMHLAANGFRAVALELPAHDQHRATHTHLLELADALVCALAAFGPIHGILAHSLGVPVSLLGILQHAYLHRNIRIVAIGAPTQMKMLVENFIQETQMPTSVSSAFLSRLEQNFEAEKKPYPLETSIWDALSLRYMIDKLPNSCLFIHDRQDLLPIHPIEKLVAGRVQSSLLITEGLGHFRTLQNGAVIEKILDFFISEEE